MRRRQFLAASATGFACTAAAGPALALSLETAPASVADHLRVPAPHVDGALDWDQLAEAGDSLFRDGTISRFPIALRQLDGRQVVLSGFMMPFREAAAHEEFILGAMQFHCTTCMLGDLRRIVAVKAALPVVQADRPVTIRGTLRLLEAEASPLYYRLEAARAA
jgi:hypothetical protein